MSITMYTTPTCGTCKMAARRIEGAGIALNITDLTTAPDLLDALKAELGVAPSSQIQVPIFRDTDGGLHDITGLSALIASASV